MKLSVSLDRDSADLLAAIVKEEGTNPSQLIQKAIKQYAKDAGYQIVPAHVIKRPLR